VGIRPHRSDSNSLPPSESEPDGHRWVWHLVGLCRVAKSPHPRTAHLPAALAASRASFPTPSTPRPLIPQPPKQRNGCPRQPGLAPASPARLTLRPHVPTEAIEGLDGFSHVWLVFVFHGNTGRGASASGAAPMAIEEGGRGGKGSTGRAIRPRTARARVVPPRSPGAAAVGVLATRSPHRPCPVGLSLCRVIGIEGRTVVLSGVDLVDGTPVLDLKPFLPFSDSVDPAFGDGGARAPAWVAAHAPADADELAHGAPRWAPGARDALNDAHAAVAASPRGSLFMDSNDLALLVEQSLARDVRSRHRRGGSIRVLCPRPTEGDAASPWGWGEGPGPGRSDARRALLLDGVVITYVTPGSPEDPSPAGASPDDPPAAGVLILTCRLWPGWERWTEAGDRDAPGAAAVLGREGGRG